MAKLKFLVSLTTNENDYQAEQASSAEQAARKFPHELQILYADNDAINQSTQILKAIQANEEVAQRHCVRARGRRGAATSCACGR